MNTVKSVEAPDSSPRGVFEDAQHFHDERVFTAVNASGECLIRVEIRAELATGYEAQLWRWLDMIDPVTVLSLIS